MSGPLDEVDDQILLTGLRLNLIEARKALAAGWKWLDEAETVLAEVERRAARKTRRSPH